jgi:hypothetical protein
MIPLLLYVAKQSKSNKMDGKNGKFSTARATLAVALACWLAVALTAVRPDISTL